MIKRLLAKFSRKRGLPKATVHIVFSEDNLVAATVQWHQSADQAQDTLILALHFYARILYELAELNESRVAQELMAFLSQVAEKVLGAEGPPARPRLPLGQLRLAQLDLVPAHKQYQAEFLQFQDGHYQLEFKGSIGKEGFYLPGAFLVFLQECLDQLSDEHLRRLATALGRLHDYYRYRRDFWDGTALSAGPAFALSAEELQIEEKPS